ncbi:DUF5694 domain-containing protein [Allosphingosinicella indica]|nr:DUF5694 domain-containing protein [Allosphingosinicella indica]
MAVIGLALTIAASASAQASPALLVVGMPHFGNPGQDIVNIRVEDVTTPDRQREIEELVARLAAFRPTRVAVEWPVGAQEKLDQRYADYRAGRYKLRPDEVDQIGLRLAAKLGLSRVDAVDWNDEFPGPDADYDFVAWAKSHGRGADWDRRVREQQAEADDRARLMACTPISAWVRQLNTPDARAKMQRPYYEIATMGDNAANPGANWVGGWYARNLRILNNLTALAQDPEARVIAIYGAGHGYLLDQQAREAGTFAVAETLAYLPASPRDGWKRCPD